jgi:hypothetical protein
VYVRETSTARSGNFFDRQHRASLHRALSNP